MTASQLIAAGVLFSIAFGFFFVGWGAIEWWGGTRRKQALISIALGIIINLWWMALFGLAIYKFVILREAT